jgi:hypothetical protein
MDIMLIHTVYGMQPGSVKRDFAKCRKTTKIINQETDERTLKRFWKIEAGKCT